MLLALRSYSYTSHPPHKCHRVQPLRSETEPKHKKATTRNERVIAAKRERKNGAEGCLIKKVEHLLYVPSIAPHLTATGW